MQVFCVYLGSFQLTKHLNDENKLPEDPTETLHLSQLLPTGQQETTKNYKNCLRHTQMTQNTYKMSLNFSWNKKNNSYDVSDTETPDTIKSKH